MGQYVIMAAQQLAPGYSVTDPFRDHSQQAVAWVRGGAYSRTSLASAVRYWVTQMGINQQQAIQQQQEAQFRAWQKNPLGYNRMSQGPSTRGGSLFNKYRR
ncbi:hypothetical protein [Ralstonia pseudosolanacearum]|uniref:Uncharacterized protein n=1 Tax=Ralstonia solanacearum TaxID=305 RepID=A0A0S4X1F6_RALSL|nr:protein of unknown function [Ralstonia solanacearum]